MSDKKKILIVDDDEFLLDMYVMKFKDSGFEVDAAQGGEAALEKVRSGEKPDVLLLDIVMPVVDGFEFLRIVKEENLLKDTIIIILTNLGQKEDIERGLRLGARDYVVKAHFTPTEVLKKVEELLSKKEK